MGKKLMLTPLLSLLLVAFAVGIGGLGGPMFGRAQAEGERGTLYIDVLPDASNTTTGYGTIDVCRDGLAIGDTFDVDIVIAGADDLAGPYWKLYYSKDVLKVTAYNWESWKLGAGGMDICDTLPDTDGAFVCTYAQGTGVSGDGVLARVTLQATANGSSDLALCTITGSCPDLADGNGQDHFYPEALVDDPAGTLRVAVGQSCSEAATPTPSPSPSASPTGKVTATATLSVGWNQVCYIGSEQPVEAALGDIAGSVQALYQIEAGGALQRWFPGRPEMSTLNTLRPYEPILVLMSGALTWTQTSDQIAPDAQDLEQGWNAVCYEGQDADIKEAIEGVQDEIAIIYALAPGQSWLRYVPDRPELNTLDRLQRHQAVLVLVSEAAGVTWHFAD
jgi:hypothetical protein